MYVPQMVAKKARLNELEATRKLAHLELGADESIAELFERVYDVRDIFTAAGIQKDDSYYTPFILNALGWRYAAEKKDGLREDVYNDLTQLKVLLEERESAIKREAEIARNHAKQKKMIQPRVNSLVAGEGGSRMHSGNGGGNRSMIVCWHCQEEGHISANCPRKHQQHGNAQHHRGKAQHPHAQQHRAGRAPWKKHNNQGWRKGKFNAQKSNNRKHAHFANPVVSNQQADLPPHMRDRRPTAE
jgi:hypothetical protein